MIEVGEYVRTIDGEIGKITSCYCRNEVIDKWCFNLDIERWENNECDNSCIIGEPSHNIIDLIEEGDYVNGQEVVTVYGYDEDGNDKDGLGICEVDDDYAYYIYLEDIDIKTILTKEQYEANCYKIN